MPADLAAPGGPGHGRNEQLLGEAVVDETHASSRRREVKEYPELKQSRYVWLKNPSNLSARHPRGQGRDVAKRRRDPGEGEPAKMFWRPAQGPWL